MSFHLKSRIASILVLIILIHFLFLGYILIRITSLERNVIALSKIFTEYSIKSIREPQSVKYIPREEFVLGDDSAPITMAIIFNSDCSHCTRFFVETFPELDREYIQKGLVKLAFIDHPPKGIPGAFKKSEAALCAMDQSKYLEYTLLLLEENELTLPDETFLSLAERAELDLEQFQLCLNNGEKRQQLEEQVIHTISLGIQGTPSLIIQDTLYLGFKSYEDLSIILQSKLRK